MKNIQPQKPKDLSIYAQACLNTLAEQDLAKHISIGGALGLFHYLDYRSTSDVDAWWADTAKEIEKQNVVQSLQLTLSKFGNVRVRSWGEVASIELFENDNAIFSFQIAARSSQIQKSIPAGWIDVPLDSFPDLVASKMVALVERGAPRDFLDIYSICGANLITPAECWDLWNKRQRLSAKDRDMKRAFLAIETHLERIALHRPLENITDENQRQHARQVREWFASVFLKVEK
jgi:hypothetical protein